MCEYEEPPIRCATFDYSMISPETRRIIDECIAGEREPLTRAELRQRAYQRVKERRGPYWCFLWDSNGGTGKINMLMRETKARALFEKTHPGVQYEMIGKDA